MLPTRYYFTDLIACELRSNIYQFKTFYFLQSFIFQHAYTYICKCFKRRAFVRRFVKDGVSYSINTDDPVVLGNTLTDDFKFAGDMGLTDEEIIRGVMCFMHSS